MDGAAGVQIRGFAHHQRASVGQGILHLKARLAHAALGLVVDRNIRLTAGCRAPPPALDLNQLTNVMRAGADDLRRLADRRRHHLKVNDNDTQIGAGAELFQDHRLADPPRAFDRAFEIIRVADIDTDAGALFTPGRLDDDAAVRVRKASA